MAFNEWQDRVRDIHKELNKKYSIDVDKGYYNKLYNFSDKYNGTFTHIISNKQCNKCNNGLISFNYRYLEYGKMYPQEDNIINVDRDSLCGWCKKDAIQVPTNYWYCP